MNFLTKFGVAFILGVSLLQTQGCSSNQSQRSQISLERRIIQTQSYESKNPSFSSSFLESLKKQNISLSLAEKIYKLGDSENFLFLSEEYLLDYFSNGGTFDYALELKQVSSKYNVKFNIQDLSLLFGEGVNLDLVDKFLNLKDINNYQFFNSLSSISYLFFRAEIPKNKVIKYCKELIDLKDSQGNLIFNENSLIEYLYYARSPNYAIEISKLRDLSNRNLLNGIDLRNLKGWNVPLEYVKYLFENFGENQKSFLSGTSIVHFYGLGLKLEDLITFKDTSKPNALVVLPTVDEYFSFLNNPNMITDLKEVYDVKVISASQEFEVYNAISSIPDIELLILSGHGIKDTLSLGEKNLAEFKRTKDETFTLDILDAEIEEYLNLLDKNAVIFLNSCSNGEGEEKDKNLANFIYNLSGKRKVFSSKLPFFEVNYISLKPFIIKINGELEDSFTMVPSLYIPSY